MRSVRLTLSSYSPLPPLTNADQPFSGIFTEKRLRKLDSTVDKQHTAIETQAQRTHVISNMLEPSKRETLHRSLERMDVEIEHLRRDVDALRSMHNGRHVPIIKDE